MRLYIGTSGWAYDDWRGRFYPRDLPRSKWFEFYSRHFMTVELNNTFYQLPSERAVAAWRAKSPDDFVYAVKTNRFITHIKKLRNVEEQITSFLQRVRPLGEKLGPLLYQLPPAMPRNDVVLESFLELLPPGLQHVFEFRNESWFDDTVFAILRRREVGLCIYDMPGFTTPLVVTADFAYVRFHGSRDLYGSRYSQSEVNDWAKKISRFGQGLTSIYIYFNNDTRAFAVRNAEEMIAALGKLR